LSNKKKLATKSYNNKSVDTYNTEEFINKLMGTKAADRGEHVTDKLIDDLMNGKVRSANEHDEVLSLFKLVQQDGGAKKKSKKSKNNSDVVKGQRRMNTMSDLLSGGSDTSPSELARMLNRQSTEIHDRTTEKIKKKY